ncbi:MAG: hypothetical protein IKV97_05845 [Clostridia bacterium]|nr:hypothetical protein [Clostridia bacterium]
MSLDNMKFHRVFSKSMYKNLKLPLGEMSFTKDFVNDSRGDLYPLTEKSEMCTEQAEGNRYIVSGGTAERMFTRFLPFATYEISFESENGGGGFVFHLADGTGKILCTENELLFCDGENTSAIKLNCGAKAKTMVVSCRPKFFDIYFVKNGKPEYFHTFESSVFANSNVQKNMRGAYVSVYAKSEVTISEVSSYIDCGISQADIRAICYENAEPIFENGKIYFTASIRMQEGGFQGIFSWTPSTSEIKLTGALFFDCGDGLLHNYLASSLLYNRETSEWYLWTSSFEHKHILCHAAFCGEPRFGVNIIDVTMMEQAQSGDITEFAGFKQDEDPDFYYNAEEKMWYMAICRICPKISAYRYMFFKSAEPFKNYKFIGQGYDGAETGGSFVNICGKMAFICGNGFSQRANYRIYTKDGMREAKFDFDDGGFRGWGTIIPVAMGSRKRYFWLTFDRHNGSSYNWSYGNIYGFEAEFD